MNRLPDKKELALLFVWEGHLCSYWIETKEATVYAAGCFLPGEGGNPQLWLDTVKSTQNLRTAAAQLVEIFGGVTLDAMQTDIHPKILSILERGSDQAQYYSPN